MDADACPRRRQTAKGFAEYFPTSAVLSAQGEDKPMPDDDKTKTDFRDRDRVSGDQECEVGYLARNSA
ncbi:hypothetical protein [Mesorhizobium sp. CA6]|uniref:hypothetical protein n=1 Tax=Mesorhizobium sp. CA6 TaxID=588500 RepID=UPI0029623D7B|nr:hypothetical protein [Mesorhizobium sp. CA6]